MSKLANFPIFDMHYILGCFYSVRNIFSIYEGYLALYDLIFYILIVFFKEFLYKYLINKLKIFKKINLIFKYLLSRLINLTYFLKLFSTELISSPRS